MAAVAFAGAAAARQTGTGIYVHLPFCAHVCPYCDFAKWPYARARAQRYLAALEREIAATPALRGATVFLGGGTPTTYDGPTLGRLIETLRERFALATEAEITVEANPEPGVCEVLPALRAAGVNRLSLGVQSFDARELRALGRRHTAADVAQVVAGARAAGFDDIALDLMFGIPHQTLASWAATLETAVALDVSHLSAYGLTIEEGTPYARWHARDPAAFADEELEAQLYASAIERLTDAGYEHYEISNFARPGRRSAHNANYWRNGEYVGLGVGAASYRGGVRSTHTRELDVYCAALEGGAPIPGEAEQLTGDARVGEAAMLALRTVEGIDVEEFRRRYDVDVPRRYARVIAELTADGVLAADADGVRLTPRGRFVANDVCGAFLR